MKTDKKAIETDTDTNKETKKQMFCLLDDVIKNIISNNEKHKNIVPTVTNILPPLVFQ